MRAGGLPVANRSAALTAAAALAPVALVSMAALVHETRVATLVLLVAGFLVVRRGGGAEVGAWAAAIPIGLILTLALLPRPPEAAPGTYCTTPLQPFTVYRILEAGFALAALAIVVPLVRAGTSELGLRRPSLRMAGIGIVGALVVAPVALIVAPPLSEPFFGPLPIRTEDPAALVPAILYALVNAITEEVIYRGALLALLARAAGVPVAIVAQAVVFGFVHGASPDYVGSSLPVIAVMTVGGIIAGIAVVRTRSLVLPIALHIAFDIPLYYGNACLTN
jgi:membrane protease YdiL (CAAX protease family)